MQRIGHAVVQRIEILAEMRRKHELLGDQVEDVLLGLGMRQVGVQEVVPHRLGCSLQVLDAIGTDGLDDIRPHTAQQRVVVVLIMTKWHFHLRCSFLLDIHKKMND